jgi:hypothetical protein
MTDFMETLKTRQQDAHKRMAAAQQKLTVAQAEYQTAAQEFNSWNYALATEMRKAQQEAAAAQTAQQKPAIGPPAPTATEPTATASPVTNAPEINKTELVRDVLRRSPNGITPSDIWKQLKAQVGDHAYIYSVLKRLKDRDEITRRRGGKYYLKHHPQSVEEGVTQNGVVLR